MEAMGFGNRTGLARENLAPLLRDSGRNMPLKEDSRRTVSFKALRVAVAGLVLAAAPVGIKKAEAQLVTVPYGSDCPWGTYIYSYAPPVTYCAYYPPYYQPYLGYGWNGYWGRGWGYYGGVYGKGWGNYGGYKVAPNVGHMGGGRHK